MAPRFPVDILAGMVLVAVVIVFASLQRPIDATAYYHADLADLYGSSRLGQATYVYAPPLAQLVQPLRILPMVLFVALFIGAETLALAYFVTPVVAALLLVAWQPNVIEEVWNGNVNLLIGAAILGGFRWPALWAFPILTKITPGIGLLWFAMRGEWRSLGIALGVTAALTALSVALAPSLWLEWWAWMQTDQPMPVMTPLWARLLLCVGLIAWAAPRNHRWMLPVVAVIAMPVPLMQHWTTALAAVPLLRGGSLHYALMLLLSRRPAYSGGP